MGRLKQGPHYHNAAWESVIVRRVRGGRWSSGQSDWDAGDCPVARTALLVLRDMFVQKKNRRNGEQMVKICRATE